MLDTYKKLYENCADTWIQEDWRKMNKNDLINKYIEIESDPVLANAYISAIVVRYWNAINKYNMLSHKSAEPEFYHEWLVGAILRGIKNRKWKDPNNKLYNDPNGPDKVINRCIISERLVWYQGANTYKRMQNFNMESIERIQEEPEEASFLPSYEETQLSAGSLDIKGLINKSFNNKEYVMAFMIDGIINYNTFEKSKNTEGKSFITFSEKKLLRHMNGLNATICDNFSYSYGLPIDKVKEAMSNCKSLTRGRMRTAIRRNMKKLRQIYEH